MEALGSGLRPTAGQVALPSVTVVVLAFNRRDKLRESLAKMLAGLDYPADRLDVIVVDNGSTDGSGDMVRAEFPDARVIRRDDNIGVSGWNDGFAAAEGEFVLALDDDAYLPGDGLRRAVMAAQGHEADLVSFSVRAEDDPSHRFNDDYNTGLLSFWGCAVLVRREALAALGGYDPAIFLWANELEFTVRFLDRGFRHLHLPEVEAVHMKYPPHIDEWMAWGYRVNAHTWAYIAGKLLRPRDAVEAFIALLATTTRDTFRLHRGAVLALPHVLRGFTRGLRRRDPVTNAEVSRLYRQHMHSFASPWWFVRPPWQLLGARSDPRDLRAEYIAERPRYYPSSEATLQVRNGSHG